MRLSCLHYVCFLLITAPFFSQATSKISINVEDMPIAHIFSLLAAEKNLNLIVDPVLEQRLTLHLSEVEWQDALALITSLANVDVMQQANILIVRSMKMSTGGDHEQEGSAMLQERKRVQRIFPLRFIEAAELKKKLLALPYGGLGRQGKLWVDHDTQQMIIWDEEASLDRIADWIRLYDQPPVQIEITAQMISISQDHLRELGVAWSYDRSGSDPTGGGQYQFTSSLGIAAPALQIITTIASIDSHLLFLELSALEEENQLEIIASPHLVTSHGRTASIKQGTEIPYQTVSGKNDHPVTNFKEAVLGMEVTPERVGQEYLRLRLRLNQDVPGKILQSEGKGPPSIDKQEITTEVVVANGATVVLGGIFQQQRHQGSTSVPGLGQLPIVGQLFKKQIREHQKRELVIFITPRLLSTVNIP